MAKIKDRIIEEAKRLFTEKGYDQVSLRGIAQAAGTTIGNLTYHFPQKEDLIEEIQKDIQTFFLKEMTTIIETGGYSVEGLVHLLVMAQSSQEGASFYFSNMVELCKNFEPIAKNTIIFRQRLFEYLVKCFGALKAEGLLRGDIKPRQYETLAYIIVMMATFWIQNHSLYYDPDLPKIGLTQAASDLLRPYFTDIGLDDYEKVQARYLRYELPGTTVSRPLS